MRRFAIILATTVSFFFALKVESSSPRSSKSLGGHSTTHATIPCRHEKPISNIFSLSNISSESVKNQIFVGNPCDEEGDVGNSLSLNTCTPLDISRLQSIKKVGGGEKKTDEEQVSSTDLQYESTSHRSSITSNGNVGKISGPDRIGDSVNHDTKGVLYDAYNLLHTLAQDFQKQFDAPAVVVVGHQSSGKSALIEALMGFQFNHVGGGTKTRRPIALRMQYNPQCEYPISFLRGNDGVERPKSLREIQGYIEEENLRLELDKIKSFDAREIHIRMEYKYCPNMILIDTPGLIAAPRIPRRRNGAVFINSQQRALLKTAREVEQLVVNKMCCPDYIILCVEDTIDWKHGCTLEIVQKADPELSRTVIVNTKLDTKLTQFGMKSDVLEFLNADIVDLISPHKMGGPFFTSVPIGRVGKLDDFLFDNDCDFVSACSENEESDRVTVLLRLKSSKQEKKSNGSYVKNKKRILPRIGLSHLRKFLECRVDECYRRNVAKIIPLLQAELAASQRRLHACKRELDAISIERLKAGADAFCDEFCCALKEVIQGSVIAPLNDFGETLEQETDSAGSFYDVQGCAMAVSDRTWEKLLTTEVGNREHRLYGGAQYHRAMREFNLATHCLRLPTITEDEIANAAGVGDTHDGVNFLRASCVIAIEKARVTFDPMIESLRIRMSHVMKRVCPVSEYMLVQKRERATLTPYGERFENNKDGKNDIRKSDFTHNPQFRQLVRTIYDKFVQNCSDSTVIRCRDDLVAQTRFVTWDLNESSRCALRRSLPDQTDFVTVYNVAVKTAQMDGQKHKESSSPSISEEDCLSETTAGILNRVNENELQAKRDYYNLLQLMEEVACSRNANRTNMVVGRLVQHIVAQWRESFSRNIAMKYNCYFLLPFIDEFHRYLRQEMQKVYEGKGDNLCDVFDIISARKSLIKLREDLTSECTANMRLQEKFFIVSRMMSERQQKPNENSSSL